MSVNSSPPKLWLLRHAQPLIAPGVCYGQLDVPADPEHTLQAAIHLSTQIPLNSIVRYSPLQRCEQLTQALQVPESLLTADKRLQEMNFGQWEGRSWNAIGQAAVDAWTQDFYHHSPGQGENLASMLQRVQAALLDSWHYDSQLGTRDVIWVTHAGVIRCVHWLLRYGQAQPSSSDWKLPAPSFGRWCHIPWAPIATQLNSLHPKGV